MKIIFTIFFFLFFLIFTSNAQVNNEHSFQGQSNSKVETSVIDNLDTVVFDMSQVIIFGNSILIPVYISSDDTIYSLDFSFMYNQNNLLYDSIANLTNYIQAFSYYNAIDSTVRFTSNSMQEYGMDTALVGIQFTTLNGNLFNSDIYSITAYLNGDPCSIRIIDPINTGIKKIDSEDSNLDIYPNPVNSILHIETKNNSEVQVYDLNGQLLFPPLFIDEIKQDIDLSNYPEGIYVVKVSNRSFTTSKKIIIEK